MEDFFENLKNRPRPNLFRKIKSWWRWEGQYYKETFKNK